MNFDNFRFDDLGSSALCCTHEGKSVIIPYEEENYIKNAIQMTISSLRSLENSTFMICPCDEASSATVLWFLSIESFFARIVKIASLYSEEQFKKFQKKDICSRISSVCEYLNIGKMEFYKSELRKKLIEFNEIRNCMFHAGFFLNPLKNKHTAFLGNPIYMNQTDIIQAADIAVCSMHMFRYIFPGVDIIPIYPIKDLKKGCFTWVSIDSLYNDVVLKSFSFILSKHQLQTKFNPMEQKILSRKVAFSVDIMPVVKTEQDKNFTFRGSNIKTSIVSSSYNNMIMRECRDLEPDSIRLFDARNTQF